jgi:hypothetical protein
MKHFFGHCLALNLGFFKQTRFMLVNELMALNGKKHLRQKTAYQYQKYQDKSLDILKLPTVELGEN